MSIWFVVKDGNQLPNQHSDEEVQGLLSSNPSSTFMVWKEGMSGWSDPRNMSQFTNAESAPAAPPSAPVTPPQTAPLPNSPPPQAGNQAASQMKEGGKKLLQGAADHLKMAKSSDDHHAYLPHLKWVDLLLDKVGGIASPKTLDNLADWAMKLGHFALLGSALFIVIYGAIFGGKAGSFMSTFGYHLVFIPAIVISQYAAVKFLNAGTSLIEKSPSQLSSKAFLDVFGLIALLGLIGTICMAIYMGIITKSLLIVASGLGSGLVLFFILGITLNPSMVNLKVGGEVSAGQEAIGILSYLMKTSLKLVPLAFGVGQIVLFISVLSAVIGVIGDDWGMKGMSANQTFMKVVVLCYVPFATYLAFLLYYLLFDVLRSVLVIPSKLDKISEEIPRN